MTAPSTELDAVIVDYNGVIGLQPTPDDWSYLADLAGWPADQAHAFQTRFWKRRPAYDAGAATDHQFWTGLLRPTGMPRAEQLAAVRRADTGMWLRTDTAVLHALRGAQESGVRLVLLSNAPHPVADALDTASWRSTLMSRALYSSRLGTNKPEPGAYQAAIAAAGWPATDRVLFIDDRLENCTTAADLGLRTLHYTGDLTGLTDALPAPHPAPADLRL